MVSNITGAQCIVAYSASSGLAELSLKTAFSPSARNKIHTWLRIVPIWCFCNCMKKSQQLYSRTKTQQQLSSEIIFWGFCFIYRFLVQTKPRKTNQVPGHILHLSKTAFKYKNPALQPLQFLHAWSLLCSPVLPTFPRRKENSFQASEANYA